MDIIKQLFSMQDKKYRDFNFKLISTVGYNSIIGVRTPHLRAFAKEIYKNGEYQDFLDNLPHKYLEENNLHAFLIEQIKDYTLCIKEINRFLPFIDNWATCDMLRPKCFKNNKGELLKQIDVWLKSKDTYTVRFAIGMLMTHFLDNDFKLEYCDRVSKIRSDEYYIKMMQAWYFATALAKQYDAVLPYIQNEVLDRWTHNKAIQKAVESYRVTNAQKQYLKTLKKAP